MENESLLFGPVEGFTFAGTTCIELIVSHNYNLPNTSSSSLFFVHVQAAYASPLVVWRDYLSSFTKSCEAK